MDIFEAKALPREKKLLLVTCNTFESQAVAKCFGHRGGRQQVHADAHVYTYLGRHGDYEVFNVVAPTQGPYGAMNVAHLSFNELDPGTLIGVGIAFGVEAGRQEIGDVLAATQVQGYELSRVEPDGTLTLREDAMETSYACRQRFQSLQHWGCRAEWSHAWPRTQSGVVLSGAKLVDNLNYRNSLILLAHKGVVGGEMEGVGLAMAAHAAPRKCNWIVVKAICDWADGTKSTNPYKDLYQEVAAWNAALVVKAMYDLHGLADLSREDLPDYARSGYVLPRQAAQASSRPSDDPGTESGTACFKLVARAIVSFLALPAPDREPFLAEWLEPLSCANDAKVLLTRLGAVAFIGRVRDAVLHGYLQSQGTAARITQPAVTDLVYALALLGLEQRVAERGLAPPRRDPGSLAMPIGEEEVVIGAVAAALMLDAGVRLEIDPQRPGAWKVAGLVVDRPSVVPGRRDRAEAIRAEVMQILFQHATAQGASKHPVAPSWSRSRFGLPGDDVISEHVQAYMKSTGAGLIVALNDRIAGPGEVVPEAVSRTIDALKLHAFRLVGPRDSDPALGPVLAEIEHYLNLIWTQLHPADPQR